MLVNPSATSIRRLKVRTGRKDEASLKRRVSQRVQSMNFRPAGLPPSAVLMIRRIDDPLPGLLDAAESEHRDKWNRAFQNQLNDIYRSAYHPKNALVKTDARAILFQDPAQLIACVCKDIASGTLVNQWWWNKTFSSVHLSIRLREALLDDPAFIPAIFTHLAEAGSALQVVSKLSCDHATHIAYAMLATHDCRSLAGCLDGSELSFQRDHHGRSENQGANAWEFSISDKDPGHSAPDHRDNFSTNTRSGETERATQHPYNHAAAPPWQTFFSHDIWHGDLSKAQALLLGLSRCIYAYPVIARSHAFQQQVTRWWTSQVSSQDNSYAHSMDSSISNTGGNAWQKTEIKVEVDTNFPTGSLTQNTENGPSNGAMSGVEQQESSGGKEHLERDRLTGTYLDNGHRPHDGKLPGESTPFGENLCQNIDNPSLSTPAKTAPPTEIRIQKDAEGFTSENTDNGGEYDRDNIGNIHSDSSNDVESETTDRVNPLYSDTSIDTELAGVFYIVNLLNQLQPHQYFGELWGFEGQLSHWAFLEAIAIALLSENVSPVKDDPVWQLLAKLDNPHSQPNSVKKPIHYWGAHSYILPLQWLNAAQLCDEQSFLWAHTNTRLRLWVDQFVLVDCVLPPGQDAQHIAEQYAQQYGHNGKPVLTTFGGAPIDNQKILNQHFSHDLSRWLALASPYLRYYLQRLLALPNATSKTILEQLFRLDGRIFISSSHIDLVTSINNVSIAKRQAGLDQDPGWLPEYGRVVLFQFMQEGDM